MKSKRGERSRDGRRAEDLPVVHANRFSAVESISQLRRQPPAGQRHLETRELKCLLHISSAHFKTLLSLTIS